MSPYNGVSANANNPTGQHVDGFRLGDVSQVIVKSPYSGNPTVASFANTRTEVTVDSPLLSTHFLLDIQYRPM